MLFFRLFRKVDPSCSYCRYGTRIGERDVACLKHGIVPVEHHCRAFRYDPLKRTPPRPALLRLGGLGEADFMLDAVPGQETLFAGMDAAAQGAEAAPPEAAEAMLPEAAEAMPPDEVPEAEIPAEPEVPPTMALEDLPEAALEDTPESPEALEMQEILKLLGVAETDGLGQAEMDEPETTEEASDGPETAEKAADEPETAEEAAADEAEASDEPETAEEAADEPETAEEPKGPAEPDDTAKRPVRVKVRAVKIRR